VHRVGRTGRAGHSGVALSLFTPDDADLQKQLKSNLRETLCTLHEFCVEASAVMLYLRKIKAKRIPLAAHAVLGEYDLKKRSRSLNCCYFVLDLFQIVLIKNSMSICWKPFQPISYACNWSSCHCVIWQHESTQERRMVSQGVMLAIKDK